MEHAAESHHSSRSHSGSVFISACFIAGSQAIGETRQASCDSRGTIAASTARPQKRASPVRLPAANHRSPHGTGRDELGSVGRQHAPQQVERSRNSHLALAERGVSPEFKGSGLRRRLLAQKNKSSRRVGRHEFSEPFHSRTLITIEDSIEKNEIEGLFGQLPRGLGLTHRADEVDRPQTGAHRLEMRIVEPTVTDRQYIHATSPFVRRHPSQRVIDHQTSCSTGDGQAGALGSPAHQAARSEDC